MNSNENLEENAAIGEKNAPILKKLLEDIKYKRLFVTLLRILKRKR